MKTRMIATACALGLLAISSASAALTLVINPINKTYAFIGTDTGTPSGTYTQWNIILPVTVGVTNSYIGAPGITTVPNPITARDLWQTTDGSSYAYLHLQLNWAVNAEQTLTADGVYRSYASLNTSQQSMFESAIGGTMLKISGTLSNIQIIPEPSNGLLVGLGALLIVRRRRNENARNLLLG